MMHDVYGLVDVGERTHYDPRCRITSYFYDGQNKRMQRLQLGNRRQVPLSARVHDESGFEKDIQTGEEMSPALWDGETALCIRYS